MPFAWSAASSRLRNSPPAAHCSVARTEPEDLEGHAVLAERLDPLDPRRLEHAALPDRVVEHRLADGVDHPDRPVDVGAVGDDHVLVDPGPDAGQVRGDLDLAVRHGVDDAIDVADRRPPQAEVLDRARDAGHADDVALGELVLDEDERAVEVVAHERLRAEPDRDADDAEAGHRRTDVEPELRRGPSGTRWPR